jgi:prepilin-type processing-associated H-X9-DG protein
MYCPRCGKENPDSAQVCGNCNSLLPALYSAAPAGVAKTSGLAIASFVLGILSFCTFFITAIPAIILGIVGLVKIGKSGGRLKGNALAIAGIVVPVVAGVFILPLMLAITLPAVARTRQIVFRMACATNMSGLGKAMLIYAGDYDEKFPTGSKWCDLLIEHAAVDRRMFQCKGAAEGPCNYAINENVLKLGIAAPPDMVLLFETGPGWNQVGGPESLTTENHQDEGCNVLFVDNHVEFVRSQELDKLRWRPD